MSQQEPKEYTVSELINLLPRIPDNYPEDQGYEKVPVTINKEDKFFCAPPTPKMINILYKKIPNPTLPRTYNLNEFRAWLNLAGDKNIKVSIDDQKKFYFDTDINLSDPEKNTFNIIYKKSDEPTATIFVSPGLYYAQKFIEEYKISIKDKDGKEDYKKLKDYRDSLALVQDQLTKYLSVACTDAEAISGYIAGAAVGGAFTGNITKFKMVILFDELCLNCGARKMEVGGPIPNPEKDNKPMCPICKFEGADI